MIRGRVYGAVLSEIGAEKYFLVVSNNVRNRSLPQVLAVRLTTTPKPDLDSIVRLGATEVFTGQVCCDDITTLYPDEVTRDLGALSRDAMAKVRFALASALGILPLG